MSEDITVSKRKIILEAAAAIFSAKGYYNAKIEDIAQQAGIGKGTVYEYFKSKGQLFAELIKEGYAIFQKLLEEDLDRENSAREKLDILIRLYVRYSQNYRHLARIAMLETIPIDDDFRSWLHRLHEKHLQIIEDILKFGIRQKEIRPINVTVFARLFYGGMGMIANPFLDMETDEQELEKLSGEITNYYYAGISTRHTDETLHRYGKI